jgi:hypothetical protein
MFEFFSTGGFKAYLKRAQGILDANWTGSYTKPAPSLYPHQWSWDSAFIAMGYARYDPGRAMAELRHLFSAQWENGMVPQIVFNPRALGGYFPEPDFWQAPQGRQTSGITMPPLHAIACLHLHHHAEGGGVRDFLAEIYPKLLAGHRYLHQERDPADSGLVYIRHPWESGLDNSPGWDAPLGRMELDPARLPDYQRRDLDHGVAADQRPGDWYYDRYVWLVDLFRKRGYDEAAIRAECPFLVQDVLFNSILCRADRALAEIADIVGADAAEPRQWRRHTARAIRERLWNRAAGQFDPWDLVAGEAISVPTAASFSPMFAVAASAEQAETLYQRLDSVSFCALHQGNCFTIPNFDMASEEFDPKNYWRGPVWLNINWMLSQGLASYGYQGKADDMRKDLIQLPVRFGFHEYFDSVKGTGYGSDGFSWTAALFIDLVHEYYDRKLGLLGWLGFGRRRLTETKVLNAGGEEPAGHRPELARELMEALGRLKQSFFDMPRGRVDYRAMAASDQYRDYRRLAARLRSFDPTSLGSREQSLAFWINLYNTIVVQGIVELEIEESVREVAGFFDHIAYDIGGRLWTPDDIEHGVLRANARPPHGLLPAFGPGDERKACSLRRVDPRVHFALVCGSRSCAPIDYYQAERIDRQLEAAAHGFVESSEVVILPEENKILLSQIFDWYRKDFGGRREALGFVLERLDDGPAARHLAAHLDDIRVEYLFYDWNLNH